MEQTETLRSRQRRDPNAFTMARVGVVLAAIGAVVIVLDLFALGEIGLIMTVVGAALAAPYAVGEGWYWALAGGAVVGVIAWILAGPHQTLGGALAVLSAILVVVGACLGYPTDEED